MRMLHRWTMTFAAVLLVYVACTGILIQLVDLKALYTHAPASDPDMQEIHDGIYGAPGFAVIDIPDYAAPTLPATTGLVQLLVNVQKAARQAVPVEPFNWVELRMEGATPVGVVAIAGAHARELRFNALTGAPLGERAAASVFGMQGGQRSAHDTIKDWHRGSRFGAVGMWLSLLTGIGLLVMVVSGLTLYFQMLGARRRAGRMQWFWK